MSRTALRRRQETAQARRDRTILLATAGVLAAVALILLVGLYLTVYLPPRAAVASIGGRKVTAAQVVDRASFFMVSEGGAFNREINDLAELGIERIVRDEVLFKEAPALVGEVTDADMETKAREALGNVEGDAYDKALQNVLDRAGVTKKQYLEVLKSRILAERLTERFRGEMPEATDQRHIQRVRTPTLVNAERVVERANAGEDFARLSQQYAVDRQVSVDQGWMPDELLAADAHHALTGLGAGSVSAPVASGLFFDVYRVVEAESARPLTDEQRGDLAERRVDDWVADRGAAQGVTRDVSETEKEWITTRVGDRVRAAFEQRQPQTQTTVIP